MALTEPEIKYSDDAKHLIRHLIWRCEQQQKVNMFKFRGNDYIPYWMNETLEEMKQYLEQLDNLSSQNEN